jgi:NitT/TauT family transport system ATP-binding protein
MVFQDYSIYPWKTVLENVRFGLDLSGVKKREGSERAMHWIARLDLSEFAQAYPDKLSGGMRQRVSIARALATDPEVIFMDEPFAALDPQLREMLQDTLLEICQQEQRTVVFITHSLEEAIVLGDRVIVMTARPGTVKLEVEIPFPRPRSPEIRDTPEFGALRADLWRILRGEVEEYLQSLHEETER